MVVWSDYYRFSAEDVEALGVDDKTSGTHPYTLTVYLKSGRNFSVSYMDKQSRRAAMLDLSRQIDSERRRDAEKIHNALYILRDSVNRIDKRQLRIWRQLRDLLGINVEEENGG